MATGDDDRRCRGGRPRKTKNQKIFKQSFSPFRICFADDVKPCVPMPSATTTVRCPSPPSRLQIYVWAGPGRMVRGVDGHGGRWLKEGKMGLRALQRGGCSIEGPPVRTKRRKEPVISDPHTIHVALRLSLAISNRTLN